MKKINDTRHFFLLLSNGDTIYFTVEKENEIYKIYCEDFIKAFKYDKTKVTPGHSIELSKNNFVLKDNIGMTICSLNEEYNKIRNTYNSNIPEIKMLYIDNDLRPNLLERGQLLYDESAYDIPGVLYEPVNTPKENTQRKIRKKQIYL